MSFGNGPIKVVEKLWGKEEWLCNGLYCAKWLTLNPDYSCSLHYHSSKEETFFVLQGDCWLKLGTEEKHLLPGDWAFIRPGYHHRFWNVSNRPCTILEVSTHHSDDDVVRLEPSKAL